MAKACSFEELSKKQQQLLLAAQDLFFQHGIRRVTIEEICRKAGVSKRTYYKYFKDKLDIARAVLDLLFAESYKVFRTILEEETSFAQKFEKILMLVTTEIHAAGSAFLDDVMEKESPLNVYFLKIQKKTRGLVVDFFKDAQKAGHINSTIKMPFVLFMMDRLSELLSHPEFARIMPDIEERASELAVQLFHGFSRVSK